MKLISLQIFPKGIKGLSSKEFFFADEITQLFGPNGCGKTPLIQAIVFCLGYPSVFRDEIYNRCDFVTLKFKIGVTFYEVSRLFSKDTDITLLESNGSKQNFFNEKDFTDYLFSIFNLKSGNLVTTSSKLGYPYMGSLLPIYYLDQDEGYSDFYIPPDRFIKDQFSEMMRIAFNLPIKNPFDDKKERIVAKEELDFYDRLVNERSRELELAKAESELSDEDAENAENEIISIEAQLKSYRNSTLRTDDGNDAIQKIINGNLRNIHQIELELNEISSILSSKAKIIDEINVEINTLSLNEDARRVFMSFSEICGSTNCSLFSSTSESYGKNLLYLRDQIKDLERNAKFESDREGLLKIRREDFLKQNIELEKSIKKSETSDDISAIVEIVSALKNKAFSLQVKLSDRKKITTLQKRYFETIIKRDQALDKYESFSSEKSFNPSLIKLRSELKACFIKWLTILGTKNISFDIGYKDDFVPILGAENVTQLKGSTKVRVVLAYHAAIVELLAKRDDTLLKFLILDTPKQHEINNDDLNKYMSELKKISRDLGFQVIFSTTEYRYQIGENDKEWIPEEPGLEQNMFLKESSMQINDN